MAGQVVIWIANWLRDFWVFFVYTVEAHMRANTQNIQQGEKETRWAGEVRKNSGEQRQEGICGREMDGVEYTG